MKSAVLVTGATGLLGTEIIKTLITDKECPVYALVRAENEEEAAGACFHLTAPEDNMPTAGELVDYVCRWAQRELNIRLRKPVFLPAPFLKHAGALHNRNTDEKKKEQLSNLLALTPYFYDDRIFDRTNTEKLLGRNDPDWRSYIDVILNYACRCNFLHSTDRNVFEQALFRMQSKSAPFKYYDVSENGLKETSGAKMCRRIIAITDALERLGIRKGSKVALTGNICTDYFGLDIAIGLVGAVSVPIYYTTPVAEIDILLRSAGMPPILTVMAMALRAAKVIRGS